jgi:hypothetical protein
MKWQVVEKGPQKQKELHAGPFRTVSEFRVD